MASSVGTQTVIINTNQSKDRKRNRHLPNHSVTVYLWPLTQITFILVTHKNISIVYQQCLLVLNRGNNRQYRAFMKLKDYTHYSPQSNAAIFDVRLNTFGLTEYARFFSLFSTLVPL